MVDLVKIRRKAKEKKDAAAEKAAAEASPAGSVSPGEAPDSGAAAEAVPAPVPQPAVVEAAPVVVSKPRRTVSAGASASLAAPADPQPETPAPPASSPAPVPKESAGTSAKLERFKETAGQKADTGERKTAAAEEETQRELELLTFKVAAESYAIEIEKIVEIVPPRATTRVPNADETIVGIISLRGTIVTVLDLRKKLGHPASPGETPDTRMVVVEHEGETAGFVVDRVSRVIKLDPVQLESPPVVNASEQNDYIRGVFQQGSTLTILLDLNRILGR